MVLPIAGPAEQAGRPVQPSEPLSSLQLQACVQALEASGYAAADAPIAVMTYLTDLPRLWLLGQSAAVHRMPLVLVGLGMRWTGPDQKLSSARRAAQIVQALAPRTAIAFADGLDAMVANAPSGRAGEIARRIGNDARSVLVGAECNSWPRCYKAQYAKLEAHAACRAAGRPTCFPNSGMFVASGAALLRFYAALQALAGEHPTHGASIPRPSNPRRQAWPRSRGEALTPSPAFLQRPRRGCKTTRPRCTCCTSG